MVFLTENWFWRGTQSAIFYYVSCTPWVEHKHKKKRRKDAAQAREKNQNTVNEQPGAIRQPAPFQTNEEWAQEIVQGPGPPKGWKKDDLYYKYAKVFKDGEAGGKRTRARAETTTSTNSPAKSDWTADYSSASTAAPQVSAIVAGEIESSIDPYYKDDPLGKPLQQMNAQRTIRSCDGPGSTWTHPPTASPTLPERRLSRPPSTSRSLQQSPSHDTHTETTGSKRTSLDSASSFEPQPQPQPAHRPSIERKLSNAVDGFKEAMRAALHPDQWNWIRYDRDDEILPNLNERVEKMRSSWANMKVNMGSFSEDARSMMRLRQTESKESTLTPEGEVRKWQRGTHPALNDLHPPVVSQLPYDREEASWMLMPPPSADVMMGRRRPDPFNDTKRRPLCVIGRAQTQSEAKTEPQAKSGSLGSEEESSASEEEESLPGWTYLQKPQRPRLMKRLATVA